MEERFTASDFNWDHLNSFGDECTTNHQLIPVRYPLRFSRTVERPALASKTRETIDADFTGMFDPLTRGKLGELFGSGTNLSPDDILAGRMKLIVSRSSRMLSFRLRLARKGISGVRLTQNLPNFLDAYGAQGKHKVDTLLGNLGRDSGFIGSRVEETEARINRKHRNSLRSL